MFQTFHETADCSESAARVARLREAMKAAGVHGFLIPRADEHQGEYVPPRAERLAWLTGFTGSAGMAAVLEDRAAIFIDGRYTLQVRDQVDLDVLEPVAIDEVSLPDWLRENLKEGQVLAYDPWLHTPNAVAEFKRAAEDTGASVKAVDNLVDAIWDDQPPAPEREVVAHPLEQAGKASADKRTEIGEALAKAKQNAAVLTLPDSIAWLFNIRGADVPHTPFALSFAIVNSDGTAEWFIREDRLTEEARRNLGNGVAIRTPASFGDALDALGKAKAVVRVDPASAPSWVADRLQAAGAKVAKATDPCLMPKAMKNKAELDGARNAHIRDGVAMAKFLHWIDQEAPKGTVTEIDAAKQLEAFRAESGALKDLSFDTISGSGPNGAIVHYRVTERTNRAMKPGELYLVDSGGQYLDGTTDITRTIPIGAPTDEMRDRFTRVLKGHIGLAMARFPEGTKGVHLDAFARAPLWAAGLDYSHGTGHGVGAYLSVHEGPQNISKALRDTVLKPGMILSNEPGYYKTGAYGIRIENLVVVTEGEVPPGGEQKILGFETLTLAPIDLRLVDRSLLTQAEIGWLNAYHAQVRALVGPHVEDDVAKWLDQATRAI
jgi:Xaa-Pro aminopeptidase